MLLLTTLLFSATAFAALQHGTPCGTNLQCSRNCLDGEYISTAANGFVCNPAATDPVVYLYGACNDSRGAKPDDKQTKELCDKQNGVICPRRGGAGNECFVETTSTKQADVEAEFRKCKGTPHSSSIDLAEARGCKK